MQRLAHTFKFISRSNSIFGGNLVKAMCTIFSRKVVDLRIIYPLTFFLESSKQADNLYFYAIFLNSTNFWFLNQRISNIDIKFDPIYFQLRNQNTNTQQQYAAVLRLLKKIVLKYIIIFHNYKSSWFEEYICSGKRKR